MNQQQQHDMYYDYPASSANRSPGSMRPGYNTIGLSSGLGGRGGRQPIDNLGHLYSGDDRSGAASYDSLPRFDRLGPNGMQSSYMLDNSQTWGYNGGLATVDANGRMGPRAVNRRAALPTVSSLFARNGDRT